MRLLLLLIILSLAATTFGQEQPRRIGAIDFYGYGSLDPDKLRAALPLREGDIFPDSADAHLDAINRINEAVKRATGHAPTDVAPLCCDAQGNWMIYIGWPGSSIKSMPYNPAPKGTLRLPANILSLYQQTMDALTLAVQNGGGEDDSRGYALATDATLRAKQLATREYALRHERLVLRVLESARDARQRIVAAQVLGYARQSNAQLAALVRASRDADETVRNNAVRALGVLARSNPKVAARIPAEAFIEMLNSGSRFDRNKAGALLEQLSQRRDPRLLGQLRAKAQASLMEMARWRSSGHAYPARVIIGRIAGIEENRLQQLVQDGQVEQIISVLRGTR